MKEMTIICKHCGADDIFYVKERVTNCKPHEQSNHTAENGVIYDYMNHSGRKLAYCVKCHKSIGKVEALKPGITEVNSMFC